MEKLTLFKHNEKTLKEVITFINRGDDCCVVNPCGSGKSAVMTALVEEYAEKKFLIFTHQKNAPKYYLKQYGESLANVGTVTYHKLILDSKRGDLSAYKADIYLLDEAHCIGAEQTNAALMNLKSLYAPIFIGFTATPQRYADQGTSETVVTRYFGGNSAGNYSTSDLQGMGLFVEPEYVVSLYNFETEMHRKLVLLENSDLTDEEKETWTGRLNGLLETWRTEDSPEVVIKKNLPNYLYQDSGNKVVVYTKSLQDLQEKASVVSSIIKDLFPGKKVSSYLYSYKNDKAFNDFEDDRASYIKILFSIDKIMETVHMDDLNILIMLRPSVSDRIITQQYGRINNVKNKRKSLVLDMVGNIDNLGKISFSGTECREKKVEELKKDQKRSKFTLSLRFVSRYVKAFREMDDAAMKRKLFSYDGQTGSLEFFCRIYCKKIDEVRGLMHNGFIFEEAFEKAPVYKPRPTEEIVSGTCRHDDCTIPDGNRQYIPVMMEKIEQFIRKYQISDEDVKQELYLYGFEALAKFSPSHTTMAFFASMSLRSSYMHILKIKHWHSVYVSGEWLDDELERLATESGAGSLFDNEEYISKQELIFVLNGLTYRERFVLCAYYGGVGKGVTKLSCEEIAKILSITPARVHQIRHKAQSRAFVLARKIMAGNAC